mgnify:FL=1
MVKVKKISLWVWVLGVLVVLVLIGVKYYNNFVTLDQKVVTQWAQVETQYQRRFDLIPNLVNSVQGILTQEQKIFGDIAAARTQYANATSIEDKVQGANQVETSFGRLLAICENYPDLRSSENIADLMAQLEGTENRVSVERGRYNDAVKSYNIATKRIPGVFFARVLGFSDKTFFEAAEGSEVAPVVDLAK